jgi:DNA-binding LacI/PurR family transcriptional regulator
MQSLLSLASPPTAVLCTNSLLALGALQSIHERNLDIPRDMAIVSFDDVIWARSLRPSLSVVSQPTREMGRAAAQMVLERLASPQAPAQRRVFPSTLVIRASSGGN